jgi:hypothetical protein
MGRAVGRHQLVVDNLEPLEVVQEATNTHVSVWLEDVVVGRPVRVSCPPLYVRHC